MGFGLRCRANRFGNVDSNRIAGADDAIRRHGVPGDRHLTLFDQALNLGPGLAAEDARQISIEAHTCFVCGDEPIVAMHSVIA